MAFGVCTNCLSRFPPPTGQKWKIFAKHFFDIVTTYNNEITSQRLLDQSQAGVYMGKTPHTPPFGPIRVPYPKGLNC